MSKGIIAGIIASFNIVIIFVVYLIIYGALLESPLAESPQAQAVLETGQQATMNAFNWWMLIDTIGGILLVAGIIFGLIYFVIKIVENESVYSGRL